MPILFDHNNVAATIRGGNGTHEASGTTANNNYIGIRHAGRIAGGLDANEADDRFFAQLTHAFHER